MEKRELTLIEYSCFKNNYDFYDKYEIPKIFLNRNAKVLAKTSVSLPETKTVSIEYICPNCETHIYSNWRYLDKVYNRLRKGAYGCELIDYSHGFDLGAFYDHAPQYTENDYEKAKKFERNIQNRVAKEKEYVEREIDRILKLNHCPICNANLIKTYPFRKYSKRLEYADSQKAFDKVWVDPYLNEYNSFIQSCDVSCLATSIDTEKNINFLKEYISNLISLESNILSMSKRLKDLYLLRGKAIRDIAYEQNISIFEFAKEIDQKFKELADSKSKLQEAKEKPIVYDVVEYPEKPNQPEPIKAFFFNKKNVEALNAEAEREYQRKLELYNAAIEECEKQTEDNKSNAENRKADEIKKCSDAVEKYTAELNTMQNELNRKRADVSNYPTKGSGKKYILDNEIKTLEETLQRVFRCRNELYSYNVVFEKYRDIVALSTFYEYLMAGRCEILEGPNGAYNIYENECRLNIIITKLDEIKENQYMISKQLKNIQSSLNLLENTMEKAVSSLEQINIHTNSMKNYLEKIADNTSVIAHNTAVTAYYAKINAELTNALGFMVALR